jgi:hypothetical protein
MVHYTSIQIQTCLVIPSADGWLCTCVVDVDAAAERPGEGWTGVDDIEGLAVQCDILSKV